MRGRWDGRRDGGARAYVRGWRQIRQDGIARKTRHRRFFIIDGGQALRRDTRAGSQTLRDGSLEAFEYLAPSSLAEAFTALGNGKRSMMLAGGTDVIVQLRENRRHCDQLIDLKHIPELMSVDIRSDGGLDIGAAVPLADLYNNREIARRWNARFERRQVAGVLGGGEVCAVRAHGRACLPARSAGAVLELRA